MHKKCRLLPSYKIPTYCNNFKLEITSIVIMASSSIAILLCLLLLAFSMHGNQVLSLTGTWEILISDAGISSMHSAVTHYGTVVLLDRKAKLSGPPCSGGVSNSGHCIVQSQEYHPTSNTLRSLPGLLTDTWCSSGQFDASGTLVQTGGYNEGGARIRYFVPCAGSPGHRQQCHWNETVAPQLKSKRWYTTNQILPDGRQILVGGLDAPNFEFVPSTDAPTYLPLLESNGNLYTSYQSYYPFIHLLPDGNLFILAGSDSILLDPRTNQAIKSFPSIPDHVPRTYPSGGSSVMLPLLASDGYRTATILVCGGSTVGAYWTHDGSKLPASVSCGKMNVTDRDPVWEMENMPFRRTMGDMVILPMGHVLIINGAMNGSQGYGKATNPVLHPVVYKPSKAPGSRFEAQNPTTTPRLYHSTANLLPDGRVLIAGSNTHNTYVFNGYFPSELSLEAFSPEYLDPIYDNLRVNIDRVDESVGYGGEFLVEVSAVGVLEQNNLEVNLMSAPFATHSFSQGQRLVSVNIVSAMVQRQSYKASGQATMIKCEAPPKAEVAPPGYYMVFVVSNGIPSSSAQWIQIIP